MFLEVLVYLSFLAAHTGEYRWLKGRLSLIKTHCSGRCHARICFCGSCLHLVVEIYTSPFVSSAASVRLLQPRLNHIHWRDVHPSSCCSAVIKSCKQTKKNPRASHRHGRPLRWNNKQKQLHARKQQHFLCLHPADWSYFLSPFFFFFLGMLILYIVLCSDSSGHCSFC